jgi:hypothetical protein
VFVGVRVDDDAAPIGSLSQRVVVSSSGYLGAASDLRPMVHTVLCERTAIFYVAMAIA